MRKPLMINIIPSLWEHRGSPVGFCLESPDKRLRYVPVSKCMSTTLSEWCRSKGWNVVTDLNRWPNDICKYVIVLRDPIQRWCSSIKVYVDMHHTHMDRLDDTAWKICLDVVIVDPHTERQWINYHGLELDRIHAIDFDDPDFSILGVDAPLNLAHEREKRELHPRISSAIADDIVLGKLQSTYRHDYWLRHWLLDKTLPSGPFNDVTSAWKNYTD